MVDPKLLCMRHLAGEHGELHKFLHNWRKQHRINKRVALRQIEPLSYKQRHDDLEAEINRRKLTGENSSKTPVNSPLEQPDWSYLPEAHRTATVDVDVNLAELCEKCLGCRSRMNGEAR